MPIKDFITNRTNRIVVGSTSAVGLIIALAVGISALTPATEIHDSNGQNVWGVNFRGQSFQSGVIVSKSLINCNTIDSTSTGMLVCGTDTGGGGAGFNSGQVITTGDARYVKKSGDTMTGALVINVTGGNVNTTGLNVINAVSGAVIQAQKTLASSGTLVVEGAASGASLYVATSIQGSGLTDCDGATQTLNWDASTGRFSCGTDTDTNTTYTAGEGLQLLSTSFSLADSISGTLLEFQTVSGSLVWGNTVRSSGSLVWEGAASGASLTASSMFDGAGLVSCSNGTTSKLLWNSTSKRFSCGTDTDTDTNTTYTAGEGLSLLSTSFSLSDSISGTLLEFQTVSGALTYANRTLASSGTLVVEGISTLNGNVSANGLISFIGYSASPQLTAGDATTGIHFDGPGIVSIHNGGTQTMLLSSTNMVGIGIGSPETKLEVEGTVSGSTLYGKDALRSSGSLVWEGAASGATLYVATSINGSGLTDCDLATQTLAWDSTSGRFSCGTDSDTTYTAGQGLTLTSTSFKVNSTLTGTLLEFDTVSGALVWANTLRSSGSLVVEGAMSGASLYAATSIRGSGLSDCDTAGTSKLLWDTTTGRFSCGTDTDTDTNTTYTAGQGLQLLSTSFRLADTISGTLLEFQTVSGSLVWGNTLRSSGSLVWEGAASGATLYAATSIKGSGLVDCDTAGTSKLLYDLTTGRFSCGTDATGSGTDLTRETPSGTIDGSNVTFTLSAAPVAGSEVLFLNGQLQEQGAGKDYTISGDTITFVGAPPSGSVLTVIYGIAGDTTPNYKAGQGLSLLSTTFQLNTTVTGSLIQASTTLASSGSIVAEGTISGSVIHAALAVNPVHMSIQLFNTGTNVLAGSGWGMLTIPPTMSGYNLVYAQADVSTAGTTNTTTVHISNRNKGNRKLLSTPVSIDSAETSSLTAAAPFVVNGVTDDVSGGDRLFIDISTVSTTKPKGITVLLIFRKP